MHTGADVDWNSVMHAAFDAHLGVPVEEFQLALVGGIVRIGTGRAEVVVRDDLQDVGRAEFADSAVALEWVMVGLEVFNSAHGARTIRRRRAVGRGMTRRFRFGAGFYRVNGFDAHICQGETVIEKGRVGSIILLDSAYELGLECER